MSSKILVALLNDDPLVRTSIRLLVSATDDLELKEATSDIAQLVDVCLKTSLHILLIGGATRHLSVKSFCFFANTPPIRVL
jgi:DNA-binding NarL/FixJ family response regulator